MLNNLKLRWLSLIIFIDLGLTVLALLLARWLRGYLPAGKYLNETLTFAVLDEPLYFAPAILIPLVLFIWLVVFSAQSVYSAKFNLNQYDQAQPIFVAVTGAILMFAGLAYFFFRDLSRFLFLYFYLFDLVFLIGWRKVAFRFLKEKHIRMWQLQHRVLIVGGGELAQNVATAIKAFAWSGLELIGFVNDEPDAVGKLADITRLVTELGVDEVVFAMPPGHQQLVQKLVFQLQPLPVNLRLVPDVVDLVFVRATIEDFAGLPLIGLREPALGIFDRLIKRTFDIVMAACLMVITLPLSLFIILLLKLNYRAGGPIFHAQRRIGEGGKIFTMYKFRTMTVGAEQVETEMLLATDEGIGFNKHPDDPRITGIGRFLRRTSLDELPQLLNVIKGNMSLVGPRPELPWLVEHYESWQYQRFAVPQGMTGWWQVKNRSQQQTYNVRVEDDLYYIHNYSFFLDLRILWMTMGALIRGDGAY